MAPIALSVMRGIFALADPLLPRMAGRLAFQLFCRTRDPARVSPRERARIDQAADFMNEARHHRFRSDRDWVVAHEFRPPGPYARTVLVLHGWNSRSEHMRMVIDGLRAAGCRVIALDLPGHGRSPGRFLNMASAVRAVASSAQWFGPFHAMVGHSFGGAVAVNAVVGSIVGVAPVAAERLVLIAAPSSIPAIFQDFGRFLNLGPRTQMAVARRVERITGQPLEAYVASLQLAAHAVPTLVVHARDDKEVSPVHAESLGAAGAHIRLAWVDGLGHRRILTDPSVVARVADYIGAPMSSASPARSGGQIMEQSDQVAPAIQRVTTTFAPTAT